MNVAREFVAVGAAAALLFGATFGGSASAIAATSPTPTPVPSPVQVSVVIPDLNPTPTPSQSSGGGSGGSTGGSSGSSGGGTAGGGLPTESFGKPTPPGEPTSGEYALQLDHDTITFGEWMTATGTGFTPGENVQFVLYPGVVVIGSFVADASGRVVARFQISSDLRSGPHTVEATGWKSKHVANKEFTITTVAAAGQFPYLWWVFVVLGALLLSAIALAIYYRRSLRVWFGGGPQVSGVES